jgi:cytochrome P450
MAPATPASIDPTSLENQQDPYPLYRWLRAHEPVHWSERLRMWLVTRRDDVDAILHDTTRWSVERFRDAEHGEEHERAVARILRDWAVYRDPPDHTRLRRLVAAAFTPRRVAAMAPRIQAIVDELLAAMASQGRVDFLEAFAFPLPAAVIAGMLGVPGEDLPAIKRWSDQLARYVGGAAGRQGNAEEVRRGLLDMRDYFADLVRTRRARPADDLVSVMLAGEAADALGHDEAVSNCILLVFAGHETTTNLLGNGLFHLLRHPEQTRLLRARPDLVPSAIEEFLRYDTPVSGTLRIAATDVTLRGQLVREGQVLAAFLAAANRDPEHFSDPDALRIDRSPNEHLSFAPGLHFCLGAPLARLEAAIAVRTLLQIFDDIALLDERPPWKRQVFFRGLTTLPIACRRAE